MYVGRAFHNGDMLVAKVIPAKQTAYVSWRGEEVAKPHYEVLCGQTPEWRHCYNHVIPENALLCGRTSLDQPVYIGRGHYEGNLTIGRISSVHRTLFIAFGGAERRVESYEILVDARATMNTGWTLPLKVEPYVGPPSPLPVEELKPAPAVLGAMPEQMAVYPPVPGPHEPPPPYAATYPLMPPPPSSSYPPPPPPPSHYPPPQYPLPPPHKPHPQPPYMPMPQPPFMPMPPSQPPFMPMPPTQPPFCGGPYQPGEMWASADVSYMPPKAVHAGHDADLSTLYVCRAFHDGELLPGKLIPNRGVAYVGYQGQEYTKNNYEVLVGEPHLYTWVGACDGTVPPGAVEAGRTRNGETLYVGRGHYSGTLTPGKLQPSHRCLYIPFGGREQRIQNYEVLVNKEHYYNGQRKGLCY